MIQATVPQIDQIVKTSLRNFSSDEHLRNWRAKERDWVNYYVHQYLIPSQKINRKYFHPTQIGIEVNVPQPKGYQKLTVPRDIVIWPDSGMSCWNQEKTDKFGRWIPDQHPIAIIEWKLHRPNYRNKKVDHERKWLTNYCKWQRNVVAYAVEIETDKPGIPLKCIRFYGLQKNENWLNLSCDPQSDCA